MQRAGLWSMLLAAVVACGVTARFANAAAAGAMLEPGSSARISPFPRRKTSRSAWPSTRASTSSCTSTRRTRLRAAPWKRINFQRDQAAYTKDNAAILGVSLDTADSHKVFCTKENLTFKLLADPDHQVVDQYGVPVMAMGPAHFAKRVTFLISPAGKVIKVWPDVKLRTTAKKCWPPSRKQKQPSPNFSTNL